MEAARIHEHCGLPVPEIADGAPFERELAVALERYPRREVQPPLEPRLHLMDVAALDIHRMLAGEHAQVIVHGLGHQAGPLARRARGRALVVKDGRRQEQERRYSERWRQRQPPPAPPRGCGSGWRGPLRGQPALERKRRRMLGQALLERLRELVLDGIGAGALDAVGEMRAYLALGGVRQAPALIVEEAIPCFPAGHRA